MARLTRQHRVWVVARITTSRRSAARSSIAVAYTQIVTISTDNILEINEFRSSVGARWTFLSDAGRNVQKDLEIQEDTDPHHDPMIPHTPVLKPGLVIHN
jgi:peroxiredoxin